MIIIGLSGKAGSGKDTTADIIAKFCHPRKCEICAFADPLRRGISELFQLDMSYFEQDKKNITLPQFGRSPREIMQHIGTDVLRMQYNRNIFILHMMRKIMDAVSRGIEVLIITDVRFENEAQLINILGSGVLIKIRGPRNESDNSPWHSHITENNIIPSDYTIYNDRGHGIFLLRIKCLSILLKIADGKLIQSSIC